MDGGRQRKKLLDVGLVRDERQLKGLPSLFCRCWDATCARPTQRRCSASLCGRQRRQLTAASQSRCEVSEYALKYLPLALHLMHPRAVQALAVECQLSRADFAYRYLRAPANRATCQCYIISSMHGISSADCKSAAGYVSASGSRPSGALLMLTSVIPGVHRGQGPAGAGGPHGRGAAHHAVP